MTQPQLFTPKEDDEPVYDEYSKELENIKKVSKNMISFMYVLHLTS